MHDALLVILVVLLVLSVVAYVFRTRGFREANQFLRDDALECEKRATAAETELGFLKTTVMQLLQRPQIVVMSEDQFTHLVQTIQATVESIIRPNSIN